MFTASNQSVRVKPVKFYEVGGREGISGVAVCVCVGLRVSPE